MTQVAEPATRQFGLVESLDLGHWIKLPLAVMRDAGPAAQTLGGLLKLSQKPMFYSAEKIAMAARLPLPTVRKHLLTLREREWIVSHGRQRTSRGWLRRTPTISIHQKTLDCLQPEDRVGLIYGVLPWWANCTIGKFKKLTWAAKAVLSVVMAKLMQAKMVADDKDFDVDCWLDEALAGNRFQLSLSRLEKETGLSRGAVVSAKRQLFRRKIIDLSGGAGDDKCHETDIINPNLQLAIIETPAGEGMCYLSFGESAD